MVDLKKLQTEMDEMAKALEEPEVGVDDFRTDPPATDAPKTAAPGTDPPGTSSPKTDAPKTKAPGTKAPGTKAPSTEAPKEDERDKTIRELREKLAAKETPKTKAPRTAAPRTSAPKTDVPVSDEDFLGEVDLDELTRDPKLFNQLLNKVYRNAVKIARAEVKRGTETTVRAIPDIVKNNIALTTRLKKVHDEFYTENKDLVPWKTAVGTVMEEMMSADPSQTYKELLPKVADETRRRLALKKEAISKKEDPPKLPRSKGGPRQNLKPETDALQKEMDEMDEALGLE